MGCEKGRNKSQTILPDNIDREAINREIREIRQKVLNKYHSIDNKEFIESDWIDKFLSNKLKEEIHEQSDLSFEGLYDLFLGEAKVSDARKKQLKVATDMFARYLIIKKKNYLSLTSISEFELFLRDEYLTQQKDPKLYSGVKEVKQRGQNTTNSKLKMIGAFYHWSLRKGYIKNNPFFNYEYCPDVYGDAIALL